MSAFLFAKQIVDMLYQFKFLDYILVVLALTFLLVGIVKTKWTPRALRWIDFLVLGLAILDVIAFLQNIKEGYEAFFKVLSAYMIYFLGRICYHWIWDKKQALVISSYVVIYANFIYKLIRVQGRLFSGITNEGEFYLYKTDMAYGMITAAIIILFLGKRIWEKWLTAILVAGYMVFSSGARMQWFCLLVIYILTAMYLYEYKKEKEIRLGWKQILLFLGISAICFVGLITLLSNEVVSTKIGFYAFDFSEGIFTERNTHSRFLAWPMIIENVNQSPLLQVLFGHEWYGERALLHAAEYQIDDSHCMYIKLLYSTGYIGITAFVAFWITIFVYFYKTKERKLYYVAFGFMMLFLMSGISISSVVFTQMTWFPFLFAGMIVSERYESSH